VRHNFEKTAVQPSTRDEGDEKIFKKNLTLRYQKLEKRAAGGEKESLSLENFKGGRRGLSVQHHQPLRKKKSAKEARTGRPSDVGVEKKKRRRSRRRNRGSIKRRR